MYKRQLIAQLVALLVNRDHGAALLPIGGGDLPVSYTHLDVYKRQEHGKAHAHKNGHQRGDKDIDLGLLAQDVYKRQG